MSIERLSLTTLGLITAALLALALAGPKAIMADQHGDIPDELVAAMDQYIADQGEESAGRCADTDIDTDIGKWCWAVESRTDTRAVVGFGPTFSEFITRVTFELMDGAWTVTSETGIPAPNDAPKVGTGLASGQGQTMGQMLLLTGAVLMIAGGVAFAASRVRPSR